MLVSDAAVPRRAYAIAVFSIVPERAISPVNAPKLSVSTRRAVSIGGIGLNGQRRALQHKRGIKFDTVR